MNTFRADLAVVAVFLSLWGLGYALYRLEPAPPAGAMPMTAQERRACQWVYGTVYDNPLSWLLYPKPRIYKVAENRYLHHFHSWFNVLAARETVTVPADRSWDVTRLNGKRFTCEGSTSVWD